jgi:hypothetical protein
MAPRRAAFVLKIHMRSPPPARINPLGRADQAQAPRQPLEAAMNRTAARLFRAANTVNGHS